MGERPERTKRKHQLPCDPFSDPGCGGPGALSSLPGACVLGGVLPSVWSSATSSSEGPSILNSMVLSSDNEVSA